MSIIKKAYILNNTMAKSTQNYSNFLRYDVILFNERYHVPGMTDFVAFIYVEVNHLQPEFSFASIFEKQYLIGSFRLPTHRFGAHIKYEIKRKYRTMW